MVRGSGFHELTDNQYIITPTDKLTLCMKILLNEISTDISNNGFADNITILHVHIDKGIGQWAGYDINLAKSVAQFRSI